MRLFPSSITLIFAWIFAGSPLAQGAAPKLDHLFPAGGQRGMTVEVTAAGTFTRWPVKAWCGTKGVDIQPGKTSGKLTITIARDTEPGVCWLRLFDEEGASVARPFVVGVLPEVLEKEPNDDPRKPQRIEGAGVVVNGRLDKAGDVDTFAVKLTRGQTLVASLEAHRTLRSPMDGVLQILSAEGFVLEQNDDYHELDPQIAFAVPRDGTYLVRVFAFPAEPDTVIRFAGKESFVYRLTLSTGPFVEYAFPLSVPRDTPSMVEMVGWNLPADLRTIKVTPRPESGAVLKLFDPRFAQPFFVRQEKQRIIVKTKAARDNPQLINMPAIISGRLERAGDVDVYQFPAKKGDRLSFGVEGRTLGFPIEPVLRLTANGKTINEARAGAIGTDPVLDAVAAQDGTYRLEVSDLFGHGSVRHVYRLRAGPITPDFELKAAADRFTLSAGKVLEIPITITRSAGFKQDINLGVEGLPKEISVTATARGITLKAPAKFAFAGPIRIVGTAKDGTRRLARAPVVELGRVTESLWLTALAR